MTRKKFIKLCMAHDIPRNRANQLAADYRRSGDSYWFAWEELKLSLVPMTRR